MYFVHPLKIFAVVRARDGDTHRPQQAGNLLHSKSLSRISTVPMHSQQQWIPSVHRAEAGFSNWQGIPPSSKFYFLFCHWSMWACRCPHFSGAALLPPLEKSRSLNFWGLCPKLWAFWRTTASDYQFWTRDYTSAHCHSLSCCSKTESGLDGWNRGKSYKIKLLKGGKWNLSCTSPSQLGRVLCRAPCTPCRVIPNLPRSEGRDQLCSTFGQQAFTSLLAEASH